MIHNYLVLYQNNDENEGRICLFNSDNFSIEKIEKFDNWYWSTEVETTQNKVNSYVRYCE